MLVARLSICPLENSPVLLESIMAPVEEIAITISDGREEGSARSHTHSWNMIRLMTGTFLQSTTTQMSS